MAVVVGVFLGVWGRGRRKRGWLKVSVQNRRGRTCMSIYMQILYAFTIYSKPTMPIDNTLAPFRFPHSGFPNGYMTVDVNLS